MRDTGGGATASTIARGASERREQRALEGASAKETCLFARGHEDALLHVFACALPLVLALLSPFALPARTHAEAEVQVDWAMPAARPDCPDRTWASERIAEQLGRQPRTDVAEGIVAVASIAIAEAGLRLTLRTGRGEAAGERVIEGSDCQVLGIAAVLIISLAVAEAREREQQTPSEPAKPGEPPQPAPRVTVIPAARAARVVVRADALLDVGFLDRPAFGPALSLGVAHQFWRGELSGLWLVPHELDGASAADGAVEAGLWAGRITGCALWGRGRLQGGPCLAAEVGQARGAGDGSPTTRRARSHTLWAAGALGARATLSVVSELALVAQTDLLVAMARPRFVTVDTESGASSLVHEPAIAQLRASLGVELRF